MDAELAALARRVGECLRQRGWALATAESCTGGWVAEVLTGISGSSDWFDCGWVTYSNAAKQELLGVTPATLHQHGAVSEETARAMVAGALARSRAQVALAVTGIAGPGGGTPEKPVGTVCFAWIRSDGETRSATAHFAGDREQVRRQSVIFALEGLLQISNSSSSAP
jgi:nicotinamide-nucleotide amidase